MTEKYMNKEFWDKEPSATHYTKDDENWYEAYWKEIGSIWYCKYVNPEDWQVEDWVQTRFVMEDFDVLMPRPDFKEAKETKTGCAEWDGKGLPPVGVECLYEDRVGTIVAHVLTLGGGRKQAIIQFSNDWQFGDAGEFSPIKKQPSMKEKMLDKWKRQSLDYAYDTERSQYALRTVFDFIIKNYKIEEK